MDDNVAGRRYLDVTPRFAAGISAVFNPAGDYPTRCSVRYDGVFYRHRYAADLFDHGIEARFEQVFLSTRGITGTVELHYRLFDAVSGSPALSYGEAVYGASVLLEF